MAKHSDHPEPEHGAATEKSGVHFLTFETEDGQTLLVNPAQVQAVSATGDGHATLRFSGTSIQVKLKLPEVKMMLEHPERSGGQPPESPRREEPK